jgi:hypothetical protein
MKTKDNETPRKPVDETLRRLARDLVRGALKASLASLDRASGHPYASLVTVATLPDCSPVLLISRLALHTQNLLEDARASLLLDASPSDGDPLAGGRVTLIGRAERTEDLAARRRFLARHPEAQGYADFPDFAFYALAVERAHYVGGFGRIHTLAAGDVRLDLAGAEALVAAEAEIVAHMNADHAAAVELYATALAGAPSGPWRLTGIDPEGCDLICGGDARRIAFASRVTSPGEARAELVRLAAAARSKGA